MADTELELENAEAAGLFGVDEGPKDAVGVYEVGYHLLPSLSDDDAVAFSKDLMAFLKKEGADFVGDHAPEKMDLAYDISKRIAGRITPFSQAYFGWVAFELNRGKLDGVKKFMDTYASVLRHLIISTTRDEVKAVIEGAVIMPTAVPSTDAIAAPKRATEEGAVVSEEALTQALDTMAAEDAAVKE